MSLAAKGAYIELLCHQWEHGSIPDDPKQLAKILGVSAYTFKGIWDEIAKKFPRDCENNLRNPKQDALRILAYGKSKKARESGSLGGQAKAKQGQEPVANAKETLSECSSELGSESLPIPNPITNLLSEDVFNVPKPSLNGSLINSQIEEILSHYPKRLGGQKRPVAVTKLKSLLKRAGAYEEILEGTKRYAQSVITLETPPKMVMMMATFYNGGLWTDTYDVETKPLTSGQPHIQTKAERQAKKAAQGELDEF